MLQLDSCTEILNRAEKKKKRPLQNSAGLNQWVGLCLCQTGAGGVHIRYRTKDISGEKWEKLKKGCVIESR